MNTILFLLAIGLIAGFLSGLIGIGGGIIIMPLLLFWVGMNQKMAQGTTLFMFMIPISILSVYNYHKQGYVDFKSALIMAATFLVGSYFGSKIAVSIDTRMLKQIFAVIIIVIGIKILWDK